jgi:hypothetical protein
MRDNSRMEAIIKQVRWFGRTEIATKEDGRREECRGEDYLSIMKDSF